MSYLPVETSLRAMRAATLEAQELARSAKPEDFEGDRVRALALERLLQRVADAGKRVSPAGRAEHPGLPWARLDELCKTISSEHERIDPRAMWAIVTREAPMLLEALHGALPTREFD